MEKVDRETNPISVAALRWASKNYVECLSFARKELQQLQRMKVALRVGFPEEESGFCVRVIP